MRIGKRQRIYGTLFGASAFVVGWITTYLLAPQPIFDSIPRWQGVTWLYLGAHFIEIAGVQVSGISGLGSTIDPVSVVETPMIWTLPPLLLVLSAVLTINIIGYTTRLRHLIQNAASVLMGYLPLLLVAYAQSMARPGIAVALTIAVLGFGVLYIGSSFISMATGGFPVFGVVSLGGIALIGLFVLFVGISLLVSLWPVIVISAASVVTAAALVYIQRTVPT